MIAPRPGGGPGPDVPLRFLVAGAVAFVAAALGALWLAPELAGHYYHPRLLALTHTVTLGWITLGIMGASYQLIPIVLERPVWSERLARWQFWVMAGSVVGMVGHFFIGTWPGLIWAAGLLAAGIVLHLVNVVMSLRGFRRWSFTARLIVIAYAGLALTAAFGLALGLDHVLDVLPGPFFPTVHAHFHLALLGWVAPMIFGVAARVYPMFLLAPEPSGWPDRLQFYGLATGAPAVALGLLGVPGLALPGAAAAAAAVLGHTKWVSDIAAMRKRPALDWGLRFVLTGEGYLLVAAVLGAGFALDVLQGPRAALAYAILALGGWVSLTMVGMMLKIVPFLVWYRVYSPQVGRTPVPTLAQIGWPAAEALAYALLAGGMGLLATAAALGEVAWIRAAAAVVAAGALAFAGALARALRPLLAGLASPRSEMARS